MLGLSLWKLTGDSAASRVAQELFESPGGLPVVLEWCLPELLPGLSATETR